LKSGSSASGGKSGFSATTESATKHRAALARCVAVGTVLLPLFAGFDVLVCSTLYTSARLSVLFAWRAFAVAAAAAAWWTAVSSRTSDRTARIMHPIGLMLVAVGLTGMAAETGGPSSLYVQGLAVVAMVRTGTVPAPARDSLLHGGAIALVYPVIFTVLFALDPAGHAAWLTRQELGLAIAQYALVVAAIACGCLAAHASWTAQMQLYEARKLGRYRLEAPIGRGGQHEVWLARDGALKRNVALKILRAAAASADALALFRREAALASQLKSPNTVRIFDFGASDDGIYYIAMEHLDGADLGALTKAHGPMTPARVIHLGVQACRSLEEAHEKGLVHRDVKPSNLFVTRSGDAYDELKLLDFGIARSVESDAEATSTALTKTGSIRGTLAYIAPECCRGETATALADVYSLGATFYQLLTGAPPFIGSDVEIVASHLDRAPLPPSKRLDEPVPIDLESIVLRCLEKDPAQRFASARELRQALERCVSAGKWSRTDAAEFWTVQRAALLGSWEAETVV